MAEIADRAVRSTRRLRGDSDPRPQLKLIAGALDSAVPGSRNAPLVAPAAAPPVLSPSSDICGVSRGGGAAGAGGRRAATGTDPAATRGRVDTTAAGRGPRRADGAAIAQTAAGQTGAATAPRGG